MTLSSTDRLAATITGGVWLAAGTFLLLPRAVSVGSLEPWFVLVVAFATLVGMAYCLPLYLVVRRVHPLPVARRLPLLACATIAAGAAVALTDAAFGRWVMERAATSAARMSLFQHALGNLTGFTSFCGLLAGLYDMLLTQRDLSAREHEIAAARLTVTEARAAATAARLETLRYQLNPHFLFNTLNAISSHVVTGRANEAEDMLSRLSEFLRKTLVSEGEGLSTLEAELEMLHGYLEIEGVRFGDRLAVEFACPLSLMPALLPPFILQPLVENAIKYGVASTMRPVTVRIEAERSTDGLLTLSVIDDGDGSAAVAPSAGVGLRNVRERLRVHYGDAAALASGATADGYRASICIPMEVQ
ncbi:Sensor histidine kinase YehU [compost metagenome]